MDEDSLEYSITDFKSISRPTRRYDPEFVYDEDVDPVEDILNFPEYEYENEAWWGADQGDGCSGPGYKAHATKDCWFRSQVVIISEINSNFSATLSDHMIAPPTRARAAEETWEQPGANVPFHPAVTRFLRGTDRKFRYINFTDLQHAENWASKHRNDRGCFMTITVGEDEYGFAYADIVKTQER